MERRTIRRIQPRTAYWRHRIPIAPLIAQYGLVAILLGAGLEGEAVVISGGVLAHKGLLPFWGVAVAATVGSLIVDQFWFFAGRFLRDRAWVRRITEKPAFTRAFGLLEKHSTLFILSFRFIYGIRTVSPIAIGTSHVPVRRFMLLNAIAAAIWGPVITWVGYRLGGVLDPLWHRLHGPRLVPVLLGVLVVAAAAILWWRSRRLRAS